MTSTMISLMDFLLLPGNSNSNEGPGSSYKFLISANPRVEKYIDQHKYLRSLIYPNDLKNIS